MMAGRCPRLGHRGEESFLVAPVFDFLFSPSLSSCLTSQKLSACLISNLRGQANLKVEQNDFFPAARNVSLVHFLLSAGSIVVDTNTTAATTL
jgi:hypothetical protein